jgi:hypothetical protein
MPSSVAFSDVRSSSLRISLRACARASATNSSFAAFTPLK